MTDAPRAPTPSSSPGRDEPTPTGPISSALDSQLVQSLTGSFFLISLRRAFRLEININEVLVSERRALADSAAHVTDPEHQSFLAWRRSVLLIVALAFVPLTALRFFESFDGPPMPTDARIVVLMPAVAEGLFCLAAFWMLGRWTRWQSQRRILLIAWVLYFVAPYFVYLYPFQGAFDAAIIRKAAMFGDLRLSARRSQLHLAVGLVFGVKAMLALAPKAISLMPGVIRASIVTKLLFPGTTAPGYLIVLAAPLYALFAYVIVLLPYQITGSGYFVAGVIGVMLAQIFIAAAGRKLTAPLSRAASRARIHNYWLAYIGILALSAGFMLTGVFDFVRQLDFSALSVATSVLSFVGNVLVLTLIGTDLIIANLHRRASRLAATEAAVVLREESERKLRQFCS